ncbi:phosphoribosylglycinamide formyltransferase [Synechococcus sp. PCC 7336]|uniref:phosphoribosylglycinamide formyltransferase n=1 Tax=Synechococcus sp. PCC 7336 TaxID=195250 RepID=UPI0003737432|nr:phosphoribosylglycinamide formyltransferase [Synechococcus sp. PCC 7336]
MTASASAPSPATQNPASPMRLGVMASGKGSNFVAIARAIADGTLNATIAVVIYNNPNAGVAARARDFGIPAVLVNHREFAQRQDCDRAIVKVLQEKAVELVVMAGWMRRVTQVAIDAYPHRMLNIHPSLLPDFPGLHPVKQALDCGVKFSGCTVHWVTLAVDSGPIVQQAVVPVLPDDTEESLQARIQVEEHRIYPEAIAIAARQLRNTPSEPPA